MCAEPPGPPLKSDRARVPDDLAARLRGFGPLGILSVLVIVLVGNYPIAPAGGLLVLLWASISRTPWRELGFVRSRRWPVSILVGIVFGVALKLLMKAIVMPLLGADPVNHAYHYLAGNRAALPSAVYTVVVGAGFGEETVFRGFAFERLGKRLGHGAWAKVFTVLVSTAVFAAAHFSVQGMSGVEQAAIVGLVFGTTFARTRRIVPLMFAHAAFDLTAIAMIYWNLESRVAHLVFG